ncbi:hypothetical protein [Nocardia sp. CS682]|uniref:hypothetical protein n=1 Tax=Nocardia sp. CS682 TaxID=1047172 RepID=UPI0010755EEC|nr:hypothetical protein [Nocardia sp. CS682]QBS44494.1 hypothetical protein DMB37_34815 [Nocardia sp. CS682]
MRKLSVVLAAAATMSVVSVCLTATAEPQAEPSAANRVTHWELSHAGAHAEGDIYWGSGYSAYASGWFKAAGNVGKICYAGSAGELGAGGDCTTAQPGRTEPIAYRFFVKTEGGVHRVDVSLFAAGQENPVGSLYCTREGCEHIPV